MTPAPEELTARIAAALGASRVVDLGDAACGGPLDLLQLAARVHAVRTAPRSDHHVTLSEGTWQGLQTLAAELRSGGQDVTPAELARALVERGLEALREARGPHPGHVR